MDYTVTYDEDLKVLVSRAFGPLTVPDVSALIDEAIPLLIKYPTANFIGDYSEGSAEGLTSDHIWHISVDSNRMSEHLIGKKLAIVLKDDVDYGLGRMWQSFTESKVPYEIQLFRTIEEAADWTGSIE